MFWTLLFLFLTIVTATIGFLGIGYGPIEPAKVIFFISAVLLVFSFFMERRKKRKHYYE